MRGPSSSHCAAALRIGRLCRDLMNGCIETVLVSYDPNGSLATTHTAQGTDMGLYSGLLGYSADDERLPQYLQAIKTAGIQVETRIEPIKATHPNTYELTLQNFADTHRVKAISTGGGMIEILAIDDHPVNIFGDFFETLLFADDRANLPELESRCAALKAVIYCQCHTAGNGMIQLKSRSPLPGDFIDNLGSRRDIHRIVCLKPVLPILSGTISDLPFSSAREFLRLEKVYEKTLWQHALDYESHRGGISEGDVMQKMAIIVGIMRRSINEGLAGTHYHDRILQSQSPRFQQMIDTNALLDAGMLNKIIPYVSAIMEVKSSMGVIVAAPTAGSCGALPGAVIAVGDTLDESDENIVKAMLCAGLVGLFIARHATFAAEVGGCQAECGSGAGMAAAALTCLAGGDSSQCLAAASLALQNSFGMICDPIANRVEAPCLGKNIMAASNVLSCSNMALAQYDAIIPIDEVIDAMFAVGNSLPASLRCTGKGGLAATPTARAIESRLGQGEGNQSNTAGFKIC